MSAPTPLPLDQILRELAHRQLADTSTEDLLRLASMKIDEMPDVPHDPDAKDLVRSALLGGWYVTASAGAEAYWRHGKGLQRSRQAADDLIRYEQRPIPGSALAELDHS